MKEASAIDDAIARAQIIKAKYEDELFCKKNVVGVGIGFKDTKQGEVIAIMVNVTQKEPLSALKKKDRIPKTLDDVPVAVVAVGKISAL